MTFKNFPYKSFLPGVNDGYSLGSSGQQWEDGYFSNAIAVGNNVLNTSGLYAYDLGIINEDQTMIVTDGATGYVGIGVTNPTQRLHVSGNGFFSGTLESYSAGTFGVSGTGTTQIYNNFEVNGTRTAGIGTGTPDSKLHVMVSDATATANANAIATFEKNGTGYLQLLTPDASENGLLFGTASNAADGGIIYNVSASRSMRFRTGGNSTRVIIDSSGNTGFMTTVPGCVVDINGGLAVRNTSQTLNTASPTLTPGNSSYIRLTLGASSSGNITVADGTLGQLLIIECVSNSGTAVFTDSTTYNLKLAANWTPTADDTLTLIFNGTDWNEITRSPN